MKKTLNTLVPDIYNVLDETNDHEVNEDNLSSFADNVKDLIRTRLRKREERTGSLRFSNLGRPDRQLWYDANSKEPKEKLSPATSLKFLYGDLIEQLVLLLVKEAGHEVISEQEELEVDGIKGHIDAVIDGVTVDVKSASPMSFTKFKDGSLYDNDPFGYIGQISSYASVRTPDTGGAFLAQDKVHGTLALLAVGPSITNSYGTADRIQHLKEVVTSDNIPPRCYPDEPDGKSGNMKLGLNCSYCAHKDECWSDANGGRGLRTFLYSGRPKFLTVVKREPDVYEAKH